MMVKEELTPNKIKGVFEHLFINPIINAIPIDEEDYTLFALLSGEQLMTMVDLAKRCKKYEDAYNKSTNKFSWDIKHARQYRDLREEFVEKLHVLNNKKGKVVTINTETFEEITKSLQKEHARMLKTCATKKKSCKWIQSGETILINGISLTQGFFYVGEYFKVPSSYRNIKAVDFSMRWQMKEHNRNYKLLKLYGTVINTELPISKDDLMIVPFSSYLDMHPTHRYEYLEWLAGHKTISEVSPETFLFYLFGIQLRMFIDENTTEYDRNEIIKHVIDLYTQCQNEDVYYLELERFIDAAVSKFFVNRIEELIPKDLLPRLNFCRESLTINALNKNKDKPLESICRDNFVILNCDSSIPKYLLTDFFYSQFASMVMQEISKMSYDKNWEQLVNCKSYYEEKYCINNIKAYFKLRYDYIFCFYLIPGFHLGFLYQCIDRCYKRIVKRVNEYSVLVSELPTSVSSSFSLFDEDFQNIHKKIHRIITDSEDFATIEKVAGTSEYEINQDDALQKHSVLLSDEQLKKVETQTKHAQEILSGIFVDNEEKIDISGNSNSVILDILTELLSKDVWQRNEVELMCQERHLMIGYVLEQINDYSYSKIEDAVIEDNDDTIYVITEYKDRLI